MEAITSPPMTQSSSAATGSSIHIYSPLFISMLGIVGASIAIIAYHLLLVKCCLRRHSSTTAADPAQSSTVETSPFTGVDDKLLQTIPIFTFYVVKPDMEQDECAVCLGELEDQDTIRILPNCKHAFHVHCIDQWFQARTSCPLCRSPILEEKIADVQPSNDDRSIDPDRENSESSAVNIASPGESSTSPRMAQSSFRLLRHCASLVLPPPVERRLLRSQLKRSLSMDQSLVVINLQGPSSPCSSSNSVLTRSGSFSSRSVRHFDRVSSKWLRSFSRLRLGKPTNATILPY